jgi:LPXTG-motif cell wall-anchored protein
MKGSSVVGILPRTGNSAWFPIAFAVSFVVSGVLLLRRRRRRGEPSAA